MTTTIWECKIGEVHSVAGGADYPMRQAVADAYKAITGVEPVFIFSGWGASLTEAERAVVENRLPAPATAPEKTVKEIMEFARHYAAGTFDPATLEDKIRRSLAAPATAPEPVAWLARYVGRSGMEQEYVSTDKTLADENDASGKARPLYLRPPATAPDELEQLRNDAARYRWCVDNNMVLAGGTTAFGWPIAPVGREEWDRYIDHTKDKP